MNKSQTAPLKEDDLDETFVRSSGPGGQNVNKVATCVVLVHKPTGVMVRCDEERSQTLNRERARRLLAEKISQRREEEIKARRQASEKKKRQNRRRPAALKEKILESKRKQSEKKSTRRKLSPGEL